MKKTLSLFILLLTTAIGKADDDYFFCVGAEFYDEAFYNLFLQELVDEPEYYPFLKTEESTFYTSDTQMSNENIEEWKDYLNLSYKDTEYLVLTADRQELEKLINGETLSNRNLSFANAHFLKTHKQALLYLKYAKYLEPYMRISPKPNDERSYYYEEPEQTAADLNYDEVLWVLKQSYKAEDDKELKLRYGYQLVRFAHYNRNYKEAIEFFEDYVAPLNYKPSMYYYALDQKAGAERGLGNQGQANIDFLKVFTHTKNKKKEAYKSIKLDENADLKALLHQAKTTKSRNDIYLLLGYNDFNNPLSSFSKIIKNDPNATQAKILMARAINELERSYFTLYQNCPYNEQDCIKNLENRQLPLTLDKEAKQFLQQTTDAAQKQAEHTEVEDRNFWYLTTAYLYFMQKEYGKARTHLTKIESNKKQYKTHKDKLKLLIDIIDRSKITPEFEASFLKKYKELFKNSDSESYYANSTGDFIKDVLANRYYLQKDYGKAFLVHQDITQLETKPSWRILDAVVALYKKQNKNDFEKYLVEQIPPSNYNADTKKQEQSTDFDFETYVAQMKGTLYLAKDELKKAKAQFDQVDDGWSLGEVKESNHYYQQYAPGDRFEFDGYSGITNAVFGTKNDGDFLGKDPVDKAYIDEFSFIKKSMNKRQLTNALIQLKEIGKDNTNKDRAVKAHYLLGNFYFNTTTLGFYRHLLTFDKSNANGEKFHNYDFWDQKDDYQQKATALENQLYFKDYNRSDYRDNFDLPLKYIKKGLNQVKDDELKARLLFTAANCEQGQFYQKGGKEFAEQHKDDNYYSEDYRNALNHYKATHYRYYFERLKAETQQTEYFKAMRNTCHAFDYYITHY